MKEMVVRFSDEVALEVNRPEDIGQVSALAWADGPGACHLENLCVGTMAGAIVSLQQTRYGVRNGCILCTPSLTRSPSGIRRGMQSPHGLPPRSYRPQLRLVLHERWPGTPSVC